MRPLESEYSEVFEGRLVYSKYFEVSEVRLSYLFLYSEYSSESGLGEVKFLVSLNSEYSEGG